MLSDRDAVPENSIRATSYLDQQVVKAVKMLNQDVTVEENIFKDDRPPQKCHKGRSQSKN
jgi:hypothetical protein